jgi:hypothetical protein
MKDRGCIVAIVLGIMALGCEGPSSRVVAPAKQNIPSLTDQLGSALGHDSRCRPTAGGDFAHRRYAAPLSVSDAELILVCTTRFEFGGMPPKRQAQAFNVLFEQPDAVQRFQSIAATAGPAGRLYALAALEILARSDAESIAADLARDARRVLVQDSDVILGPRPASDLVDLVKARQIGEEFRRDRNTIIDYYSNKAG